MPAVTYEEFYKGHDFDAVALKGSIPFTVVGTYDEGTALNVAIATSPVYRSGLWRQNITLTLEGHNFWRGVVHYGAFQRAVGQWHLSFDTTGGTLHITISGPSPARYMVNKYGTNAPYTEKGPAPIGAHGDQIDGCDIVVPALKLTWTFRHPKAFMTLSQIKRLAQVTGMTNKEPWMTFAANELLFLGCTGREGSDTEAEVTYNFVASQNATGLSVGTIGNIAKKGHDYIDIHYKDSTEVVGAETKPIKDVEYVLVHRVYDEINFHTEFGF